MPWTTPETFTAGQTLTAASMNLISGNLVELARVIGKSSAVTSSFNTTGTHTNFQDITDLSCSVTYGANRLIRVTVEVNPVTSGGANNIVFGVLRGSTTIALWEYPSEALSASYALSQSKTITFVGPSSGATETFKVQMRGTANTQVRNYAAATYPSIIVVQDLGAA